MLESHEGVRVKGLQRGGGGGVGVPGRGDGSIGTEESKVPKGNEINHQSGGARHLKGL